MTTMRTLMLSTVAIFAIGAITSASASAAPCEKNTKQFALCFNEPLELVTGSFRLNIGDDPAVPTKAYILTGSELELTCTEALPKEDALLTGSTTGVRFSNIVVHLIGCTAPNPPHCIINGNLILTKTLDGVTPTPVADRLLLFLPEAGIEFATVKVESSEGTCLVAGTDKLNALNNKEGEGPLCAAPDLETTTILHLIECAGGPSQTRLKFAGKEVSFKGDFSTSLVTQKTKWAVILGK